MKNNYNQKNNKNIQKQKYTTTEIHFKGAYKWERQL